MNNKQILSINSVVYSAYSGQKRLRLFEVILSLHVELSCIHMFLDACKVPTVFQIQSFRRDTVKTAMIIRWDSKLRV